MQSPFAVKTYRQWLIFICLLYLISLTLCTVWFRLPLLTFVMGRWWGTPLFIIISFHPCPISEKINMQLAAIIRSVSLGGKQLDSCQNASCQTFPWWMPQRGTATTKRSRCMTFPVIPPSNWKKIEGKYLQGASTFFWQCTNANPGRCFCTL